MIPAYPLQWPLGWPRANVLERRHGKFGVRKSNAGSSWKSLQEITVAEATRRVLSELASMNVDQQDIVISTNIRLRLDGLPRSGEKEPNDTGVAVYWVNAAGENKVMPIDQYWTVADNLAAVAATLDAMRAIERHGGSQILDRAFTGFTALPSPGQTTHWRSVLGAEGANDIETVKRLYRSLSSIHHPDRGGNAETMAMINQAWAQAQEALGNG